MRITSIERSKRGRRFKVAVDGSQTLSLSSEVLTAANLRPGSEIDDERLAGLKLAEARHSAMTSALRLLSYRQRSLREMNDALHKRRFSEAIVSEVLERLTALRLLNDREFAANWAESRARNSPRSRRMILAELAQKGVSGPAAAESVEWIDDEQAAINAAQKRALSLDGATHDEFRRKIGEFLGRRGFDYEASTGAIKRLWAESSADRPV